MRSVQEQEKCFVTSRSSNCTVPCVYSFTFHYSSNELVFSLEVLTGKSRFRARSSEILRITETPRSSLFLPAQNEEWKLWRKLQLYSRLGCSSGSNVACRSRGCCRCWRFPEILKIQTFILTARFSNQLEKAKALSWCLENFFFSKNWFLFLTLKTSSIFFHPSPAPSVASNVPGIQKTYRRCRPLCAVRVSLLVLLHRLQENK